ncbi:MAG: ethanolamine ammonia-lyase subunit EutB [Acidobacteriota bacterium]|nr:ethanolamine ammonia-lyase subunit EutB [Acidobacteriota bacterium]
MNRQELLRILALSSEFKEGDLSVGGTADTQLRAEARRKLANLRLGEIAKTTFVEDDLSELLAQSANKTLLMEVASLHIGSVKRMLLSGSGEMWWQRYRDALSAEIIAAVVKLMTNDELATITNTFFNPLQGATSDEPVPIGSPHHLGSYIQANNPRDNEEEILFTILEGLTYGCGDVLIGLTPANNDAETITRLGQLLAAIIGRLNLPSRFCLMTGITAQTEARSRFKLDVAFQSLTGTSKALTAMTGLNVTELLELTASFDGVCFETGQGSELLGDAAEGVDMATLESRAFGFARCLRQQVERRQQRPAWIVANSLVGLNSQQAFRSGEQILRASLESSATAKLHGLTIGLDVCTAFQSGIEPATLRQLTAQIAEQAAPSFLNAIAGNADPLLGHLTTSFRQHPALRIAQNKRIASAMYRRLDELGIINGGGQPAANSLATARLYSQFAQSGGNASSDETLQAEGLKKLERLKQQGLDLGYGHLPDYSAPKEVERRLENVYSQARRGMHARQD